MYKRILLPTDFSENALNAIKYALDLYADQKCEFYLLNTYEVDGYALSGRTKVVRPEQFSYESAKQEADELFVKLLKVVRLHSRSYDHDFHTVTTYNTLVNAAKDIITKHDIEIVVMGTKGITGSRTVVYGTNTIGLMEKVTECPVLAIPENVRFSSPKEIVFPTDYTLPFRKQDLRYLINIAKMHKATIQVLHIKGSQELGAQQLANKELLSTLFKGVDHSFQELEGMSVAGEINSFIERRQADMVAFINQKHNFIRMMFSRPLVKEFGFYSRIPVLGLKHRE